MVAPTRDTKCGCVPACEREKERISWLEGKFPVVCITLSRIDSSMKISVISSSLPNSELLSKNKTNIYITFFNTAGYRRFGCILLCSAHDHLSVF